MIGIQVILILIVTRIVLPLCLILLLGELARHSEARTW
jgi:hypothetical protein